MNTINWQCFNFEDLSLNQLYEVLQLRQKIFVVEQNCAYLDADGVDMVSTHLLGFINQRLVAYSRIVPAGAYHEFTSIGRVVVTPEFRTQGIGKQLIKESLFQLEKTYGKQKVLILAQSHLQKFYEGFDFQQCSEEFLEDGIPHIKMCI